MIAMQRSGLDVAHEVKSRHAAPDQCYIEDSADDVEAGDTPSRLANFLIVDGVGEGRLPALRAHRPPRGGAGDVRGVRGMDLPVTLRGTATVGA